MTIESRRGGNFVKRGADMDDGEAAELVTIEGGRPALPPVLLGRATPAVVAQVEDFYHSVAAIFDRWVARRPSRHTRRAYRQDVLDFVQFLRLRWPEDATRLLGVTVAEVQAFRDRLAADGKAPKTINRRIAS